MPFFFNIKAENSFPFCTLFFLFLRILPLGKFQNKVFCGKIKMLIKKMSFFFSCPPKNIL